MQYGFQTRCHYYFGGCYSCYSKSRSMPSQLSAAPSVLPAEGAQGMAAGEPGPRPQAPEAPQGLPTLWVENQG